MIIAFEPLDVVQARESVVTRVVDITEDVLWDRLVAHTDYCGGCDVHGLCDVGLTLMEDLESQAGMAVVTAVAA